MLHTVVPAPPPEYLPCAKLPEGNTMDQLDPECYAPPIRASVSASQRAKAPTEHLSPWRETTMILKRPSYVEDVEALDESEKVKKMLLGMRDSLAASVDMLGGKMDALVDMDVWAGRFEVDG
ncbi:hypothetical protein B0T25DRAFT_531276 [Lasiosphaeria hispida]|uniref:Uncharacterized protein n=1 Tax=Lasiosphaeria hispida TaxID=260671 RepID=A0AAJ0MHC8_9PEZI|nr:hypothetical protein B0T25DRAFT_531276 [Lasiosphaeria hispida]